jgi:outer membrane usher protein
VERYDGATVTLVDAAGQPVPSGAVVAFASGVDSSIVGYDGIVFVAHVKPENELTLNWTASTGAGRCVVRFAYDINTAAPGATIGPLVCQSEKVPLQ